MKSHVGDKQRGETVKRIYSNFKEKFISNLTQKVSEARVLS